jgi:amino acid transporter
MLYSRAAFGDMAGFLVGWFTWITRVAAWAALANGLVTASTALWPSAIEYRVLMISLLIASLAASNIAGVTMGARVNNLFTAAKIIPILLFISIGVFYIKGESFTPFAPHGLSELAPTTMIILWAFVGFEVLTIPAGEMHHPRRTVPRALILVMTVVTVVYLLIWAVCTGTYPDLAASANPVADAAEAFMGARGGALVAFGILLSVLGINAGSALVSPRALYALAHEGYLPRRIAWVHPVRRTPVVAIVVTSAVTLLLALSGSYVELAVFSVVARFIQYIPTCLAVIRFRRNHPDQPPGFLVPWGPFVPVLAVVLCLWLLVATEPHRLIWGGVGLAAGLLVYVSTRLIRRRGPSA